MKKARILSLLLVSALVLSVVVSANASILSIAEETIKRITEDTANIKAMNSKELWVLQSQIIRELFNRAEAKSIIVPSGVYVAGLDFPAGRYKAVMQSDSPFSFAMALTFNSEEVWKTYTRKIDVTDMEHLQSFAGVKYYTFEVGKPMILLLEDGYILDLTGDAIILSPYTGLEITR